MTDTKAVMQQALDALVMVRDAGVTEHALTANQWNVVYNAISPLFELIEHSAAIAQPDQNGKKGEIQGFMCLVDWQHEFGESAYGTKVYGDIDDLRQHSPCVIECGIAEVSVRLVGTAQKQDFNSVIAQPKDKP